MPCKPARPTRTRDSGLLGPPSLSRVSPSWSAITAQSSCEYSEMPTRRALPSRGFFPVPLPRPSHILICRERPSAFLPRFVSFPISLCSRSPSLFPPPLSSLPSPSSLPPLFHLQPPMNVPIGHDSLGAYARERGKTKTSNILCSDSTHGRRHSASPRPCPLPCCFKSSPSGNLRARARESKTRHGRWRRRRRGPARHQLTCPISRVFFFFDTPSPWSTGKGGRLCYEGEQTGAGSAQCGIVLFASKQPHFFYPGRVVVYTMHPIVMAGLIVLRLNYSCIVILYRSEIQPRRGR